MTLRLGIVAVASLVSAVAGAAPPPVYVADFELAAAPGKSPPRGLPKPPGPLGNVLPNPPGASKDPATRAREIVDLMARALVDDLAKAGVPAERLRADAPRPTRGWLVRGVFTQLYEGDRMRRAMVGFGAGQARMQVAVALDDLAHGVPKPLYESDVKTDSGRMPGAGPMIVLAPPVAAARFALAGSDLERSVKNAAAQIAADVAKRVRQ